MSRYVIMQMEDGLGNQMFQYAAARTIAHTTGGTIILLPASNPHSKTDYRPILFLKGLRSAPPKPTMIYQQNSSFEAWSPERFVGTDVITCRGHFQYLPAINPVLPFIKEEFLTALAPMREQLKFKYNISLFRRVSFIHIRRGDYLNQSNVHWVQGQEYYERAVQTMESRYPKALHWYVLTDDVKWCREQPWLQGKQVLDEPELAALAFMSLCKGAAVISNSSFSWWGAMLSGAPTAYPSKWFKDVEPELFPSDWVQV